MSARVPVYLTMKPDGKLLLKHVADDLDIPVSALVRMLLNEALKARYPSQEQRRALVADARRARLVA